MKKFNIFLALAFLLFMALYAIQINGTVETEKLLFIVLLFVSLITGLLLSQVIDLKGFEKRYLNKKDNKLNESPETTDVIIDNMINYTSLTIEPCVEFEIKMAKPFDLKNRIDNTVIGDNIYTILKKQEELFIERCRKQDIIQSKMANSKICETIINDKMEEVKDMLIDLVRNKSCDKYVIIQKLDSLSEKIDCGAFLEKYPEIRDYIFSPDN